MTGLAARLSLLTCPATAMQFLPCPQAEIEMQNPDFDLMMIGHAAALCLSRAIARAVFEATPAPNDLLPCWRDLNTAKDTS